MPLSPDQQFTVGVLQLDDYQKALEKYSEEYKQLLYFSMQNIINEILAEQQAGLGFVARENEFILLFCSGGGAEVQEITRLCELASKISAGICSFPCRSASGIPARKSKGWRNPTKKR
ncbi:hypothetical protein HMSSN036_31260 [Paenibacillus macerans]|nr:hypothetical protein HMSSN036_31260 [Paenibacillus macerans]